MVLGEQKYVDFGLKLTAGCRANYVGTATQIGPEVFAWLPKECAGVPLGNLSLPATRTTLRKRTLSAALKSPYPKPWGHDDWSAPVEIPGGQWSSPSPLPEAPPCAAGEECSNSVDRIHNDEPVPPATATSAPTSTVNPACLGVPANQTAFYQKNGFWITNGYYDLRPETMESYYYAYRITGDSKYQDWAWEAFVAINKTARTPNGFSSFRSVNTAGGGSYGNNQESFFFAEVMKYAYMIFAKDGPWQVNFRGDGRDQYVYNTEAHPVKAVYPPL